MIVNVPHYTHFLKLHVAIIFLSSSPMNRTQVFLSTAYGISNPWQCDTTHDLRLNTRYSYWKTSYVNLWCSPIISWGSRDRNRKSSNNYHVFQILFHICIFQCLHFVGVILINLSKIQTLWLDAVHSTSTHSKVKLVVW